MPGDSNETRARILEAATAEFAAHGLAGARVDRLAKRAGCNKQLIYAYFGSKEQLFYTTIAKANDEMADVIDFNPRDLPGYARNLHEFTLAQPELARLIRWHALERPGVAGTLSRLAERTSGHIDELAAAQAEGYVDDTIPAALLLAFTLALIQSTDDEALVNRGRPIPPELKRPALAAAINRLAGTSSQPAGTERSEPSRPRRRATA